MRLIVMTVVLMILMGVRDAVGNQMLGYLMLLLLLWLNRFGRKMIVVVFDGVVINGRRLFSARVHATATAPSSSTSVDKVVCGHDGRHVRGLHQSVI